MATATIVPAVAAKGAQKAGEAVVEALKTPILRRKVIERWDEDRQEWVPETREREHNLNAAGLAVGGLLALIGLGTAQRAARTGTVYLQEEQEFKITETQTPLPIFNPATKEWFQPPPQVKTKKVWAGGGVEPKAGANVTIEATGRRRNHVRVRTADGVQEYKPVIGRLLG